jgi:hypothetical protein
VFFAAPKKGGHRMEDRTALTIGGNVDSLPDRGAVGYYREAKIFITCTAVV